MLGSGAVSLRPVSLVLAGLILSLVVCRGALASVQAPDPAALPPLPDLPSVELKAPARDATERLSSLLDRLAAQDLETREMAVSEILEVSPNVIGAIRGRMGKIADRADRGAMKGLLTRTRRKARDDLRQRMRNDGTKGKVETPDYLEMLTRYAEPDSESWRNLVEVVAMSRMLVQIGGVQAARELVDFYVRFGEFLRVDVQLGLAKMGDAGIAALIEARRHEAEKIGRWAERQLDVMGKAIPSEAIATDDHEGLADILRAYGRSRDLDAARIVISFANSEKAQVRQAARQAVVMLGDAAIWQLRDAFENTVGERPPRDWSWERTARELFGRLDRLRLSRVFEIFESGRKAREQGNLEAMRQAYDKVLARSPRFEHAAEMVPGYLEYARQASPADRERAIGAVRRALRLNRDPTAEPGMQSLLLTLRAEAEAARGIADQTLLRRALELDGGNDRAKDLLDKLQRDTTDRQDFWRRYGGAVATALVGLIAIAVVLLRKGRAGEAKDAQGRKDMLEVGEPTDQQDALEPKPAAGEASPSTLEAAPGEAEASRSSEESSDSKPSGSR